MKNSKLLTIVIILFALGTAIYFYPLFPEQLASHWNMQGMVDGYMGKFWGLFLVPLLMVVFTFFFYLIPKIDPEKKNIEKFKGTFESFILIFNLFMLYVYVLTILWNIGYSINMTSSLMPAFALLFYFMGYMMGKVKRNYMIGIRLPWTLASDVVWDKTHKLGEKLFKLTGIITLLGTFFSQYAFCFLFFPIIISIIYLFIYSYFEYQKVK
jgi:uncharacterized membrane protein